MASPALASRLLFLLSSSLLLLFLPTIAHRLVSDMQRTDLGFSRESAFLTGVEQLKSDVASSELWQKNAGAGLFTKFELFSHFESAADDSQVEHGMFVIEENAEKSHFVVCEAVKRGQHTRLHVTEKSDSLKETTQWNVIDFKRSLLGDGAHRQLKSNIVWRKQWKPYLSTLSKGRCSVILIEKLPKGIFADEYELQRLKQCGAFKNVYIHGDKNLELSAIHSNQSTVEVHVLTSMLKQGDALLVQAEVFVPLHSRYPPLSSNTHYLLNISVPDVFLTCSNGQGKETLPHNTKFSNEEILGVVCGESLQFPLRSIQWPVPSGNSVHLDFVSRFTAFSAFLGFIVVFFFSHLSSYASKHINTK